MKSIICMLLFPYLLPFIGISAIALAYMLVTPHVPNVTGPTGSAILGAYFMMLCVFVGGVAQVVAGVPYCLLLRCINSPAWRVLLSALALGLGAFPFLHSMGQTRAEISEIVATVIVIVGCFAAGIWICLRAFHPERTKREKSCKETETHVSS